MRFFACLIFITATLLDAAENRIVKPVNYNRSVTLTNQVHPRAQAVGDRGPVDPAMPIRGATLFLKPAPEVTSFLTELQLPASPNYQRWLTPDQFGERFGVGAEDLAKVTAWLESEG